MENFKKLVPERSMLPVIEGTCVREKKVALYLSRRVSF